MAIVRSREALVGCRTQLVNHVRGAVKSFGARLPKCPAVSFHKRAAEHIPEALWPALGPILEQIGSLTQRIRDYERKLEEISKAHYPETQLLRQVEGIGPLTALTFVLSLEDPYRFAVYAATKFGLGAFTKVLRKEVHPRRVRVTLFEPGPTRSELGSHVDPEIMESLREDSFGEVEFLGAEDVARGILWALAQPERINVNEVLFRPTDQRDW